MTIPRTLALAGVGMAVAASALANGASWVSRSPVGRTCPPTLPPPAVSSGLGAKAAMEATARWSRSAAKSSLESGLDSGVVTASFDPPVALASAVQSAASVSVERFVAGYPGSNSFWTFDLPTGRAGQARSLAELEQKYQESLRRVSSRAEAAQASASDPGFASSARDAAADLRAAESQPAAVIGFVGSGTIGAARALAAAGATVGIVPKGCAPFEMLPSEAEIAIVAATSESSEHLDPAPVLAPDSSYVGSR